jgi:ribosome recycling factor
MDLADLSRRMHGALSVLHGELAGLRTGRASISLLEPIQVEAYGSQMPLNQVGTVSVPESRMLSVQVWDKTMVGAVDRAIRESNLGLNPIVEGTLLRIPIPELNTERRQELVKVAHKYAEQARVAVRHVRRDGLDGLKKEEKDGSVSQDEQHQLAEQVQKLTDEMIAEIDQLLTTKEAEISQV